MSSIKIDKLVRSKRKTVALMVTAEAALVVRAPLKTPLNYIHDFVYKHRVWIDKQKALASERKAAVKKKEFVDGERFLYLGVTYQLKLAEQKQIELKDCLIFPATFLPNAHRKIIEWYAIQALNKISERVALYSKITGWQCRSVSITNARRRWGSCGPTGTLNFSWRLIMAPISIVDYVVVHELAHLKERNHSARFWGKVKEVLPDYKLRNRWLKDNGRLLDL